MQKTLNRPTTQPRRVRPSRVNVEKPFTLEQELKPFGAWVDEPIWVPPKDSIEELAKSMVTNSNIIASREERWESVIEAHRSKFTQVREIDLTKASIRLPKGKFFVSVTEKEDFDTITDTVPACVQTRLEEFLDGPGQRKGVKVYYLKPLCVEADDQLILTTHEKLMRTIDEIKDDVFEEFWNEYLAQLPGRIAVEAFNKSLAIPRRVVNFFVERQQKAIDAFEAKLEFQRRKVARSAAKLYRKSRSDGCTFDDIIELTEPKERTEVVKLYGIDNNLSATRRRTLMRIAAGSIPWFVSLSAGASLAYAVSLAMVPPVVVCDPAFVAEMPDNPGVLLKIGHFDEVDGVTHVEL